MKQRKQKINESIVVNKTYFVKKRMEHTISLADKFKTDPQKKERHEKQECPVCFYVDSRIGGAMMMSVKCAVCEKVMQFPSTATDLLCLECAKKLGLCRHCGSDIDAKQRRNIKL